MRILLTNDDGINALGLRTLYSALREQGHLVDVVAPLTEQSAVGGSLSMRMPLHVFPVQEGEFCGQAVDGTPVDCVKLALSMLLTEKPDLVVSGLNNGGNMGADVFYSGTVAAATEGAMLGYPAVAVSRGRPPVDSPYECAAHAAHLISHFDWSTWPKHEVLNINYPPRPFSQMKGIRLGRMAVRAWYDRYQKYEDPFGRTCWWLSNYTPPVAEEDTDIALVRGGWIALTPLRIDRTDQDTLKRLAENLDSLR